jgi:hypothetical protein
MDKEGIAGLPGEGFAGGLGFGDAAPARAARAVDLEVAEVDRFDGAPGFTEAGSLFLGEAGGVAGAGGDNLAAGADATFWPVAG